MFPKPRKPDNDMMVTLGDGAKAALDSLADHYKKAREEMASDLLRDALFAQQEHLFREHVASYEEIPAIVRMANAILSQGIDAGGDTILLIPTPEGSMRVVVRSGSEESEMMTLPPHIQPLLLARYEGDDGGAPVSS